MGGGGTGVMARPKRGVKTTPVRLTDEAIRWAKIASGYTGESMADYVCRVVVERGKEDADRLHAAAMAEAKKRVPPASPK